MKANTCHSDHDLTAELGHWPDIAAEIDTPADMFAEALSRHLPGGPMSREFYASCLAFQEFWQQWQATESHGRETERTPSEGAYRLLQNVSWAGDNLARKAILPLLEGNRNLTQADIVRETGLHKSRVSRAYADGLKFRAVCNKVIIGETV